jgi:hypothetical protein
MASTEYKLPATLKEGAKYYLMEKKEDGARIYSKITFASYSPDPVFVYIKNSSDRILYVLREDLFEKSA